PQALRAHYGHQWHHAHESLAVSRATHDQAQAEFTQAKVPMKTCERELTEVGKGLEDRRRASDATAADRQRLTERIRELEQALAVSAQPRSILAGGQQGMRREVSGGRGRAGDDEAKSERLRAAAGDIETRVKRLHLIRRDLEREVGRLDTLRKSIISQMSERILVLRGRS